MNDDGGVSPIGVEDDLEATRSPTSTNATDSQVRGAFVAFLGAEAVALALFLWLGRTLWFSIDEWDFLARRTAWDSSQLLNQHGGAHPSILQVLAYRLLWTLFGLRTYVPYQVLLLALHLIAVLLLRAVMRRAGVRPWTATIVASLALFFGAGYQDIVWPTLIGYNGAIVFGLAQLLIADHDGPPDRRDAVALLAGLAAMACSAVALMFVFAVGVAMWLRRGWRVAAIQTLPLGGAYLLWWVYFARPTNSSKPSAGTVARFVIHLPVNTFHALGQLPGVDVVLMVVFAVGLTIACATDPRAVRDRLAAPLALVVGAVLFVVTTAAGRTNGKLSAPDRSRYLYVTALLLIPALGIAADLVIRRWRRLTAVVLACFVVGIPGNVRTLADYTHDQKHAQQSFRRAILVMPRLALATRVPRALIPETEDQGYTITVGWLLDGVRSGRIPDPGRISAAEVATNTLRLSLTKYYGALIPRDTSPRRCVSVHDPVRLRLTKGQVIGVRRGAFVFTPVPNPPGEVFPLIFAASGAYQLGVIAGPIDVSIVSAGRFATLCAPDVAFEPTN